MNESESLALVQGIVGIIAQLGPLGVDLYLKLKSIGNLSADEQQNIHDQIQTAISIDDDTLARIAEWKKEHNLA